MEPKVDYVAGAALNRCECGHMFGAIEMRAGVYYLMIGDIPVRSIHAICPECGSEWYYHAEDVKLERLLAKKNPGA